MRFVKVRITSPTIALFPVDGRHVARTVPGGAIVSIDESLINQNKLVEVLWNETEVKMFAQDVRARGEKVAE
jgi:hypothetical protein